MHHSIAAGLAFAAAITGVSVLCPLCGGSVQPVGAQRVPFEAPAPDTATVRLHISGMTCGGCPTTARLALQKLSGVYSAKVTLADSLGVVRYDPTRVTPAEISAHLARLTGFTAKVLVDTTRTGSGGK